MDDTANANASPAEALPSDTEPKVEADVEAAVSDAQSAVISAKDSVLTRVKALISGVEASIAHDEEAIVAWIKARL